jgi:uncharacterized protein
MSRFTLSNRALLIFYSLVFIVEWTISPLLVRLSPAAIGVIAFLPTPIAFLVAVMVEGKGEAGRLLRLSLAWRLKAKWYLLAILIPTAISLLAMVVAILRGATPTPRLTSFLVYIPFTFILAAGEEIGWHGYAVPRLRTTFSPWLTAVIFGTLHAIFHLPMYLLPLPEELRQASPFWLFLLMVIAFAFYRVWFFERTGGNVPLAIVYHTAINTSALLLAGVDRPLLGWLLPAVWLAAMLPLLVIGGLSPRRTSGRELVVVQ